MTPFDLEAVRRRYDGEEESCIEDLYYDLGDALVEVKALRVRLTLTPERIEAAAAAAYTKDTLCRFDRAMPDERSEYLETATVMLKAAGMEETP